MINKVEYNGCIFVQHMYGRYLKEESVGSVMCPHIRIGKFLNLKGSYTAIYFPFAVHICVDPGTMCL